MLPHGNTAGTLYFYSTDGTVDCTPPSALACGRSLTHLARSCADAFRASVGSLSEQHRFTLQAVMRAAMSHTQTLKSAPHTDANSKAHTLDNSPQSNTNTNINTNTKNLDLHSVSGPAVRHSSLAHTNTEAVQVAVTPLSAPMTGGGFKFNVRLE